MYTPPAHLDVVRRANYRSSIHSSSDFNSLVKRLSAIGQRCADSTGKTCGNSLVFVIHAEVRRLLIRERLWKAKRVRRVVIHQLRERRARLGELVQIDGSPHDWFEGRAPKCKLRVFVPGKYAQCAFGYWSDARSLVTLAFYSDRFGASLATGQRPRGTCQSDAAQDRLTKELRLRGLSTFEAANGYLPTFIAAYNARFAVAPRSAESAYRPLVQGEDLDRILTLCEKRTLSKNLTLSYNKVIYQIKTKRSAYTLHKAQVEVREKYTGEITIEYKQRPLEYTIYREQEQQQAKVIEAKLLQPAAGACGSQAEAKALTCAAVTSLAPLRLQRELNQI